LHHIDPVPAQILVLINRLSDLLFVMARYEVWQKQLQEDRWRAFAYKRKLKGKEV
ncbi:MAG: ATP:cob(I)alamin adenosyltransferase, partial [Porphyromonas endodontalis]